ncbi:unnamed protein product, partial [marine sediment metagenome]
RSKVKYLGNRVKALCLNHVANKATIHYALKYEELRRDCLR